MTLSLLSIQTYENNIFYDPDIGLTSTILGQEVAERVLEDVHIRAGYIQGILFVLLIQK